MNVALLLDMAADGFGDRVAFGSRDNGLTFATLRSRARAVAATLTRAAEVTTLAIADTTGPVVPTALFGAAWAGRTYAPLNFRLPPDALARLIGQLGTPVVVARPDLVAALPGATACPDWLAALGDGPVDLAYPEDPSLPAVVLFTSGTSAEPKAALLDHNHLTAYIFNTLEFGSAEGNEATILAVPPFHVAGVAAVLSACYTGRRLVPMASFDADQWLATVRQEAVTHAFVVPTMLARIVAAAEADANATVPSLQSLAYGGARMPAPVLERALRLFPGAGFVNAYGLTETSSTVAVLGPDDHREAAASGDPLVRRRLSSVGRPVPGIEVSVQCPDGARADAKRHGEIHLRGPQVSGAYVGHESPVDAEGWLHTGDMGWIDEDGYLYVAGRGDDVIIRGGENISPSEIEDSLLRHPAVAAVAVVGLPDEEWGERVGAMVVLRAGVGTNGEELFRWTRERLGSLKTPEVIVFRSELPATATGKVVRRQVQADLS
jgi:acyl-CoA synthetase (AMP-forming)/AMP-acid ligase II